MQRIDPVSLVGQHAFTPAEDELLLRAVVKLGVREGRWESVCDEYLVSKTPDQVQFRYDQLSTAAVSSASVALQEMSMGGSNGAASSANVTSSNKFHEYVQLAKAFSERDQRWQVGQVRCNASCATYFPAYAHVKLLYIHAMCSPYQCIYLPSAPTLF